MGFFSTSENKQDTASIKIQLLQLSNLEIIFFLNQMTLNLKFLLIF